MSRVLVAPMLLLSLTLMASGCALRSPNIADVQHRPSRFADRTIEIEGTVTTSWGLPLVPFSVYKIDDGTGELTVVGRSSRVPTRGARVRVKGRLAEFATVGGRALGLHLEEQDIRVSRRS